MNKYNIGTPVRLIAIFRNNLTNELADPTQVVFVLYYLADGATGKVSGTWQYGVNAEVVRDATGTYHMDYVPAPITQFYTYKVYSTGNFYSASDDEEFLVK